LAATAYRLIRGDVRRRLDSDSDAACFDDDDEELSVAEESNADGEELPVSQEQKNDNE